MKKLIAIIAIISTTWGLSLFTPADDLHKTSYTSLKDRLQLNNFLLSSYSYGNTLNQNFSTLYMGQFIFDINKKNNIQLWLGLDLATYNPNNGLQTGIKPTLDMFKGLTYSFNNKKDFSFKIKYGEDINDQNNFHFFSPYASTSELQFYYDKLDSLSVQVNKKLFNGKVNVSMMFMTPKLGLRELLEN